MSDSIKKVFITGASEGLGRTFAKRFANEGYSVTVMARNEERLQSLVKELQQISSAEHNYLSADLASAEGQDKTIKALQAQHFDVLINNAGFSYFGPFNESPLDKESAVLAVNVEALMKLSHAYLNVAQAGDALINLSSLTYYLPTPIQASYVASKCWIGSFSESLWYQARKKNVYVQGLCPGIAKTEFINRAGDVNHKNILDMISVTPEQVVNASYKALLKRKGPIVLTSIPDHFMVLLMKLLPRKVSVWMMGKVGDLAL